MLAEIAIDQDGEVDAVQNRKLGNAVTWAHRPHRMEAQLGAGERSLDTFADAQLAVDLLQLDRARRRPLAERHPRHLELDAGKDFVGQRGAKNPRGRVAGDIPE